MSGFEYAEERALTAEQTLRKFLFTLRICSQTWAPWHEYADLHPHLLHALHNQQKGFSPVRTAEVPGIFLSPASRLTLVRSKWLLT